MLKGIGFCSNHPTVNCKKQENASNTKLKKLVKQLETADSFESAKISKEISQSVKTDNTKPLGSRVKEELSKLLKQLENANPFESARISKKILQLVEGKK